jgi:hypothetical protein
MDPIPIVVERLLSSSEKSNSESFLLSAFYKGLLLLVAALASLIGTQHLGKSTIDCDGSNAISKSTAEMYCLTHSFTAHGLDSLSPGT